MQFWISLDELCSGGDGVSALNLRLIVPLYLVYPYFLLILPFSIISCLPGVSLHVFFMILKDLAEANIFFIQVICTSVLIIIIITRILSAYQINP